MGNVYCSIGKDRLVADHRSGEKHSLGFIDRNFQSSEELYQIIEEEFKDRFQEINAFYFTAPNIPAYFIKTDEVLEFKANHKADMLYRTLSPDEESSIIYSLPKDITRLLLSFNKPVFFVPTSEILIRGIRNHSSPWIREYRLYTFLMDDHMTVYLDQQNGPLSSVMYKCENPEDALYYSLLLLDSKGIEPGNVTTILGGRGDLIDATNSLWKKYFHLESDFFDKELHRKYFDLKALSACV